MAWLMLLLAGGFEVVSVPLLKEWQQRHTLNWGAAAMIALGLSFFGLSQSLASIPVGTAYAVWTGIGSIGAAVSGAVLYKEAFHLPKIACLGLILAGMIGLKLTS